MTADAEERGTMMRKCINLMFGKMVRLLSVTVFAAALATCATGCGMQDEAMPLDTLDMYMYASVYNESEEADTVESAAVSTLTYDADTAVIYVYVCGEVNSPGVYELLEGSRCDDALKAAGGFSENADRSYVNLAAKLSDGERLYFPGVEEAYALKESEESKQAGLVNINTADEALLCTLPGIGSSRAQDIITYREKNGSFDTKEDIMKVSGIKSAAYGKICDMITVN
jgi:competence protein ComEA